MSRTAERRGESTETRFLLIEGDMDRAEHSISDLTDRMGKVLWALLGILISTTTAAVLLALNLVVK